MSGIYIPGISMPDNCHVCDAYAISDLFGLSCPAVDTGEYDFHGRPKGCPLIPVPPHGRLIDADALLKQLEEGANQSIGQAHYTYSFASAYVRNAPTIIPAEEGE